MRPVAASCQRQIRHFHSFLRVFQVFRGFFGDFYNFCSSFAGLCHTVQALEQGLSRLLRLRDQGPVQQRNQRRGRAKMGRDRSRELRFRRRFRCERHAKTPTLLAEELGCRMLGRKPFGRAAQPLATFILRKQTAETARLRDFSILSMMLQQVTPDRKQLFRIRHECAGRDLHLRAPTMRQYGSCRGACRWRNVCRGRCAS